MYLSTRAVLAAIKILSADVHPFIGITFVACKRYGLPIGDTDAVSLDTLTRAHMDRHHRIDRRSAHYFQPFRGSASWWVAQKYPSSGLRTVNTQTFPLAFIHPRNTREWGFAHDYLEQIKEIFHSRGIPDKIPADALAVWLFKDEDIGETKDYKALVELFYSEFRITDNERRDLFFNNSMEQLVSTDAAFVAEPLEMTAVLRELEPPPDAEAEGGAP